jgi:UDP-GlcNAc:undecaprenyl-phosphate/decaprenyl-phosphate GlcNAc-1-phosphate transferase
MKLMAVLVAFLGSGIIVATLLTWLVRHVANRYGLSFAPSSSRHLHSSPIPRLGGVAIFFTFLVLYAIYRFAGSRDWLPQPLNSDVLKVIVPATGLFLVGLFDDLRGLTAKVKLLAQIAGGCCLFYSGLHFISFNWHGAPAVVNSGISLLATVFWVVLVCNAINLIDGLDGLASGAALFSMATIFTVALAQGRSGVAVATLVLGGAILGFLIFNFNPASIFLGDCGSLFVGFMLSGFVLAEAQRQQTITDSIAIPLISLAVPLTDTALSVLRRFLSGHSLFGADKEHIHHKLLELGMTQHQVVWILYGASAACAVLSLSLLHPSHLMVVPVAGIFLLLVFFGVRKLGYHELAEFQRVWKRVAQQKRVFARDIAMRKATAELPKLHNFDRVLQVLENCLRQDFDGFELALDAASFGDGPRPCNAIIQRAWRNGYQEKMVLTLELSTPRHGLVGRISCHRQMGSGWLVDTDLLVGSLQNALGVAIDNCMSRSEKPLFEIYTIDPWGAKDAHYAESQYPAFAPTALPPETEFASASGDD